MPRDLDPRTVVSLAPKPRGRSADEKRWRWIAAAAIAIVALLVAAVIALLWGCSSLERSTATATVAPIGATPAAIETNMASWAASLAGG